MESNLPRPTFKTPRPIPVIVTDQVFSHKKKGIAHYSPPKPPAKSAPPISRVFKQTRKTLSRPQAVSFRERNSSIESPHYNAESHVSYFEQCFKVLSKLGTGSFGEAFKVQSIEDGKLYAVKKSRVRFKGDFDRKQKLEEVHKHEQIHDSRNCVKFYRAWEERQFLFIQTELCEVSLKDYAEKVDSIDENEIWNILVDLTMGLKHLHDHNFVHMDIKPANLFLGRDGYYKIGDFGLALDVSKPKDVLEAQEGDPKYMAPELMQGAFTKAADIFSLGITMLELACDMDLPKGGELWQDLREERLPFEFTGGLSRPLLNLIKRMMSKDPRKRPTVEDVLADTNVKKIIKRRDRYWIVSRMQMFGSLLMSYFLQFMHFLVMLIMLPKTLFVEAPGTPQRRLPPSDLDSTFPHSSDSSLSFDGHESIFNNSSDDNILSIPSPRRRFCSDCTGIRTNFHDSLNTPDQKLGFIMESSPDLGSSPRLDTSLTSSPRLSPLFDPMRSLQMGGTPMSEKLPRTRLFSEDDIEEDFDPKSLIGKFNDAASNCL